jgi:hypothetical protein
VHEARILKQAVSGSSVNRLNFCHLQYESADVLSGVV